MSFGKNTKNKLWVCEEKMDEQIYPETIEFLNKEYEKLINAIAKLRTEERELKESIKLKKQELDEIIRQNKTEAGLRLKQIKELEKEKEIVDSRIADIKADMELLKKEEKSIIKAVEKLEIEKRKLDLKLKERTKAIDAKEKVIQSQLDKIEKIQEVKENLIKLQKEMEELEHDKFNLQQEVEALSAQKGMFFKIKDLQNEITALQKEKEGLMNDVTDLEAKKNMMMKTVEGYASKITEFEDILSKKSKYKEKEKMLLEKERKLEEARKELEEEKKIISEARFSKYVDLVEKEGESLSSTLVSEKRSNVYDIYKVMEDIKSAVKKGEIDKAKKLYIELSKMYESTYLEPDEKRRIYYMTLDLKNDIDLAELD